jgi:hypothetical protein
VMPDHVLQPVAQVSVILRRSCFLRRRSIVPRDNRRGGCGDHRQQDSPAQWNGSGATTGERFHGGDPLGVRREFLPGLHQAIRPHRARPGGAAASAQEGQHWPFPPPPGSPRWRQSAAAASSCAETIGPPGRARWGRAPSRPGPDAGARYQATRGHSRGETARVFHGESV